MLEERQRKVLHRIAFIAPPFFFKTAIGNYANFLVNCKGDKDMAKKYYLLAIKYDSVHSMATRN